MGRKISLVAIALIMVLFFGSFGQAADYDFDDLFGDDLFLELEEADAKPEEALLVQDRLEFGGNYSFSAGANRVYIQGKAPVDRLLISGSSRLFLDARPGPNFRLFSQAGLNFQLAAGDGAQNTTPFDGALLELFADFNYDNKVFFRTGKQNVKWGVGYFFSPADVISIGRIDPGDPGADREGPLAIKVHYPRKTNNYYTYVLFSDLDKGVKIALAPKFEFVLGRAEIGLGGFFQKDKAPRVMATVTTFLGDLSLFGEAVVSRGSDKKFFDQGQLVKKDDLFVHLTAGGRYSYHHLDNLFNFDGAVQYYYNGEGTGFGDMITKPQDRHSLACALSWSQILNSDYSASAFWLTNLSDRSGMVSATLSLPAWGSIRPRMGVSFNYGNLGTEYGLAGKASTVFLEVGLGSGSF